MKVIGDIFIGGARIIIIMISSRVQSRLACIGPYTNKGKSLYWYYKGVKDPEVACVWWWLYCSVVLLDLLPTKSVNAEQLLLLSEKGTLLQNKNKITKLLLRWFVGFIEKGHVTWRGTFSM